MIHEVTPQTEIPFKSLYDDSIDSNIMCLFLEMSSLSLCCFTLNLLVIPLSIGITVSFHLHYIWVQSSIYLHWNNIVRNRGTHMASREYFFFCLPFLLPLYFLSMFMCVSVCVCVFFFNTHVKINMMKMVQISNIIYFAFTKVHYTLPYLFIYTALRHVSFEILWIYK